jgi:hypothetical protein
VQIDFASKQQDIPTVLERHRSGWGKRFQDSPRRNAPSACHQIARCRLKKMLRLKLLPPDTAGRTAIDYTRHRSRSHDAVVRVYDVASNVIEMHEHAAEFRE